MEATNSLKDYLVRHFDWKEGQSNTSLQNILIFGRTSIVRRSAHKSQTQVPSHLLTSGVLMRGLTFALEKMPELDQKNPNGRRVIHFHGLRKFFRTTVGNVCGRDFAEALIGHGFYMDTYYVLSEDQKRELYLKAEPYLTISDFKSVEKSLDNVLKNYKDLEFKFNKLMNNLKKSSLNVPMLERN